jgi:hypothetical protein
MQQRPTGVTILALLAAILGVLGIIGGLTIAGLGSLSGGLMGSADLGALAFVFGGAELIVGAVSLAFAIGAWSGRPWAWALGVIAALANIVLPIIWLLIGASSILNVAISLAISGIILYYLNQPTVKRFFGR